MYIAKGLAVWLVIIIAESVHGTFRQIFMVPVFGDFTARRIAFFSGMAIIFAIAYGFVRWIGAPDFRARLAVGFCWTALTAAFEIGLGRFVFGFPWERIFEDYDVTRGGLMAFGLLFLLFAPELAHRARG